MSLHSEELSRAQLDLFLELEDVLSPVVGMMYVLITMPLVDSYRPLTATHQEGDPSRYIPKRCAPKIAFQQCATDDRPGFCWSLADLIFASL